MIVYRSKERGGTVNYLFTLSEKTAEKSGQNEKQNLPTAAAAENGRFRHFEAPRRRHESSDRLSGKPPR